MAPGNRFAFNGRLSSLATDVQGTTSGYHRFAVTAVPFEPGRTGVRIFCADSTGSVRAAKEGPLPPLADGLGPPSMEPLP